MGSVVFQTVEILVPFTTDIAAIRLLFLHTEGAGIWSGCIGVNDGKCTICVIM